MRGMFLAAAIAALMARPGAAAPVLSDDFDGENGGATAASYAGFANFDSFGSVDLFNGSDIGGTCTGSCVGLDNIDAQGGVLVSKATYAFAAGDTVRLTFDLGGSGQAGDLDLWFAGFDFGSTSVGLSNYGSNFTGIDQDSGATDTLNLAFGDLIFGGDPMATRSVFFTAAAAGSFTFTFSAQSFDGHGPLLDNVVLSNSGVAAVPEPESWALMIAGFALSGLALRRRAAIAA